MKYLTILLVTLLASSCVATKADLIRFQGVLDAAVAEGTETKETLSRVSDEVGTVVTEMEEDELTMQEWLLLAGAVVTAVAGVGKGTVAMAASKVNKERDARRVERGEKT